MVAGDVLADDDAGAVHIRVGEQDVLGLGRFDAESAEFDLAVRASDVFDVAARGPPHEVTGAVHAAPVRAVGVGDEPGGGRRGAPR